MYLVYAKSNSIPEEQLRQMVGDTMVLFYKTGKMLQQSNSIKVFKQLYIQNENVFYNIFNDTIYPKNCNRRTKKQTLLQTTNQQDTVAGYNCYYFIQKFKDSEFMGYYAPDLYVNPAWFKKYKSSDNNKLKKKCQGIYLKMIQKTPNMDIYMTAIEVHQVKLDDNVFALPNLPIKQQK